MIGQRLAVRRRIVLPHDHRTAFLDTPDVGIDVLQTERELVGIEAFGRASELHPLELFDDRLKALDLAVAMLDDRRHVAHQLVQKRRVGRQIVEIEPHARYYYKEALNPSISAGFSAFSACLRRPPYPLGKAPVDALQEHRELRRRQRDRFA